MSLPLRTIPFQNIQWKYQVFSLYRKILNVHKQKLLPDQRAIGDAYVRQEFRLNKVANEKQSRQFMTEWHKYYMELESAKDIARGKDMDRQAFEELSDEMKEQLLKLKEEAEGYAKSKKA